MKKNKYILLWPAAFFFIVIILILLPANTYAQEFGNFPYEESCMNGKPANMLFPAPQGNLTNSADFIRNEGLRLTPSQQSRFGAVFIGDRLFGSQNGITVEFEYMIYGGNGGDGLSMFLFDADVQNPTIGAHGAGIGYTYSNVLHKYFVDRSYQYSGLTGAYMGIAFDVYGNFKTMRYYRNQMIGGIYYYHKDRFTLDDQKEAIYDTGNQVTIRGARGGDLTQRIRFNYQAVPGSPEPGMNGSSGQADVGKLGFTGYPVLITRSTNATYGFILNDEGKHSQLPSYNGNKFTINGYNNEYRKAIIELFPVPEDVAGGGFYVTVKIQHGELIDTIIEDYHYKETLKYRENAMIPYQFNSDTPAEPTNYVYDLNANVPDRLRIGFAASTGESTNNHVIKNIKITLPRAAEAYNDESSTFEGMISTINPFVNDVAYEGIIKKNQIGSPDNIDEREFRFVENNGTIHKLAAGESIMECQIANEGTWKYDSTNKTVTFTPLSGFLGDASILYDIKGKPDPQAPYADEAYRSLYATIKVKVEVNPNPPRNIISNKMITPRLK